MTIQRYKLISDCVREHIIRQIRIAPWGRVVTIAEPTRTVEQNARMWAQLGDIANQVDWYGNKLTPEEWKDVFSAALKKQRAVPGIDGGFVILGQRTSKMTKREMADLIELMNAFCAERGVKLKAPDWQMEAMP